MYDGAGTGINNLLFVKNDHASAVNTVGIYVQQDSTEPAISATGGIVEEGGALKENLLTNSGFDVWSQSTLENVGSDLVTNGAFGSDASGWTAITATLSAPSNVLRVTSDSGQTGRAYQDITTVVGKLYKLSLTMDKGTSSACSYMVGTTGDEDAIFIELNATPSTQTAFSTVFEATATTTRITMRSDDSSGTDYSEFDSIVMYEVTPGCVGAGAEAPEGWQKAATASLKLYREHNDGGTNTYDGSFYGLKSVSTAGGNEQMDYPHSDRRGAEWYQRFAGRTVTLGMWVKSNGAGKCTPTLVDSAGSTTTTNSGTGWEWLEVTRTVNASPTDFYIRITFGSSSTTYVSQPMLVFGSSIGEGNYTRPQGDMVYGEASYDLTGFAATAFGDVASATDINLEATSNGRIPKGAMAIYYRMGVNDANVSFGSPFFELYGIHETNGHRILFDSLGGAEWDDKLIEHIAWLPCNSSGDVSYTAGASGSDTLDVRLRIMGVQLR